MKKFLFAFVAMFGLMTLVSCSEDTTINNYDVTVENVTIPFGLQSIVTEADGVFEKGGKNTTYGTSTDFDNTYQHVLPTSATAIFVADETKGKYTQGQVIEVLSLTTNTLHTITIPALKYKVYATNYNHEIPQKGDMVQGKWYTNSNAFGQMPQSTTTLLLHGSASIDYSVVNPTGVVTMKNPYSAVMVKKNENVHATTAPLYYGNNANYTSVGSGNNSWYLLYIRANTTNTKVTLAYNVNNNNFVNLNTTIEPNKIYQYTYRGVSDVDGGFTLETEDLINGVAEIIDLY